MLPGIENSIRSSNNGALYTLAKEIQHFKETKKWPCNSTIGYFVEEFSKKYVLSEPEVESQLMDAVTKASATRFRKAYEALVDIAYEAQPGGHTVTLCSCGKKHARKGLCILCLAESVTKE
jgi:hypothetical protein